MVLLSETDSDGHWVTGNTDQAELGDHADIGARALLGTCTPGKWIRTHMVCWEWKRGKQILKICEASFLTTLQVHRTKAKHPRFPTPLELKRTQGRGEEGGGEEGERKDQLSRSSSLLWGPETSSSLLWGPHCSAGPHFRSPEQWGTRFRSPEQWGPHFRSPEQWGTRFRV